MPEMTQAQIETFLEAPRHAIVGTIRRDGTPQLSPVWYLYDDGCLYISILADSAKYHNLKRDPRLSVCIDGCHPDARTVTFMGTAELLPSGHPLEVEMKWRIIRHYHETEATARAYAQQASEWASVLVVLKAQRLISQDFNS